ncbi:MAG: right-handed parallel beta-helix repeat-containing protein, partial [Deltaproteobacteria bacterium]|nr:right-handed parallel beta-helix repeat-containing protein [Deltaproteobacteria bacterium]
TGNNAVQIRGCASAVITVNDGQPLLDTNRVLFDVSGNGNVFDGLSVANVDDGWVMFALDGSDNVVRNTTIASYERTGVMITGTDNTVINNVIRGGTAAVTVANAAAVMVSGQTADRNRIVSNVLVQNAHDGIRVMDGDDLLIDHNTISGNLGDALSFFPTAAGNQTNAQNLCVRNNLLSDNVGAALRAGPMATMTFSTACELSLTGGLYGNDQVANGAVCAGTACTACACLTQAPVGGQASFFEYSVAPAYASTTFGDESFFCVAGTMLIDVADIVDGDLGTAGAQPHDLNGRDPGSFVSTAPDIGGRESGAEGCY